MFITRGLLITLEGIDGCGKSTQAALLQHKLEQSKLPFVAIREPGNTPGGEAIRKILLQTEYSIHIETELLLYMAARAELVRKVIIPALHNDKVVVCDRFSDSTLAYQGYGGGLDLEWIQNLNERATGGIVPNLTFLFDLTIEEAARRRVDKPDRMESHDTCYYRRVRRGYLEIADREKHRFQLLDASQEASKQSEVVWQSLIKKIKEHSLLRSSNEL